MLLASFTSSGEPRWAKAFGGAGEDRADCVALAPEGSLYLAGNFHGTLDLGTGPVSGAEGGMFVARLPEPH